MYLFRSAHDTGKVESVTTHAELDEVAEGFRIKVETQRLAHFAAANHLRVAHYILGVLLIVVSAVVSGSVLQATDGNPSQTLTLSVGVLSIIVVVLTAVQTTFKLGERGEQHRGAASGFGRIERRLEVFVHSAHPSLPEAWEALRKIGDEIGEVEAGAPGFLGHTYDEAKKEVLADRSSAKAEVPRVVPGH